MSFTAINKVPKTGTKTKTKAKAKPQPPEEPDSPMADLEDTPSDIGTDRANTADSQHTTTAASGSAAKQLPMASAAQLAEFKSVWDFGTCIDAWNPRPGKDITGTCRKGKDVLKALFANDKMYRAATLRLFAIWASLTSNAQRNDQMQQLVKMLYNRWGGHRKTKGKSAADMSIGSTENNCQKKDENLRSDLRELLGKWYPDADLDADPEGDDEVEEEPDAGEVPSEGEDDDDGTANPEIEDEIPGDTHSPQSEDIPSDDEDEEDEHAEDIEDTEDIESAGKASEISDSVSPSQDTAPQQPLEEPASAESEDDPAHSVRTEISHNWDDKLEDYLPENARPKKHVSDWPLNLLEAILELSRLTAGRKARAVRLMLQQEFQGAGTYRCAQSVRIINDVVRTAKDVQKSNSAGRQSSGGLSDPDNGVRIVEPTATTSAAADRDHHSQMAVTDARTPTLPSPLPQPTLSQTARTRPAEGHSDDDARSPKRHRFDENTTDVDSPAHLSPEDQLRHREAVHACRRANSERVQAEIELARARERRSTASERGYGDPSLEDAVLAAEAEVQVRLRAIMDTELEIMRIDGVVSYEVWRRV